jgi:anaerobic magnesium-protoporphyrin IX monomethyl ester cyclase
VNVLLVFSLQRYYSPEKPLHDQNAVSLGLSYISSCLKSAAHTTRLVVLTPQAPYAAIRRTIVEFSPRLVCFTAIFSEYPFIAGVARYVRKEFPDLFLLAGGTHVSLNPDAAMRDDFDALCIGEGEQPTLELVQQLEAGRVPGGISNLWIRHGEQIEKCPPRDFLDDLDSLPFPDRAMWQEWIAHTDTSPCVLLGRGCPFTCTYCCNHALRKLAGGRYVRLRSAGNVVEEVSQVAERLPGVRDISLEVETIGSDAVFAADLCRKLIGFNEHRAEKIRFSVNLRVTPGRDYSRLFESFAEANFSMVNIGLESGSERVRNDVLHRHYGNDDIIRAVKQARQHGLQVALYVLLGLPGETRDDFQETVECTRRCEPDDCYLSIFTPYPGTRLHARCEEMGLLSHGIDMRLERRRAVFDMPGFTRRQIQREYIWFPFKVYRGRRPLVPLLRKVVGNRIRSSAALYAFYAWLESFGHARTFRRGIR